MNGLYLANGEMAVTQFEPEKARRVFPLLGDSPNARASLALTIRAPRDWVTLSNGPVLSTRDLPGTNLKEVVFKPTPPISSYLYALASGPLVSSPEIKAGHNNIPVRVWTLAGKGHLTRFALDTVTEMLPWYEKYLGQPFPFDKLDLVAVPDFGGGAMENVALIVLREAGVLVDPATAPLWLLQKIEQNILHELFHQWGGDMTTMEWWDALWLNEALASFMGTKASSYRSPHRNVWNTFNTYKALALSLDSLGSSHPVHTKVESDKDAAEHFDDITYYKGASFLRMLEDFIGPEAFRRGLADYLQTYKWANATTEDLLRKLALASKKPIAEIANAWLHQTGYPLVSLSIRGNRVVLTQRRFFSEPGLTSGERWPIPIMLRFSDSRGTRSQRVLLSRVRQEFALDTLEKPRWVAMNGGPALGFYRGVYDPAAYRAIVEHLGELNPQERVAFVGDQWAMVQPSLLTIGRFLDLASSLKYEPEYVVLNELESALAFVESCLVKAEDRGRFHAYVTGLFADRLAYFGWEPNLPMEHERLLRASLLRLVGVLGQSERVLLQLRPRVLQLLYGNPNELEPNLRDSAVTVVARQGGADLFDLVLDEFRNQQDPGLRRLYLIALTSFEDPRLIERAQQLFAAGEIPKQDTPEYVSGLLSNPAGRQSSWEQLRRQWKWVIERTGGDPMVIARLMKALESLPEQKQLDSLRAILAQTPVPGAEKAAQKALEQIAQNVAFRERVSGALSQWLAERTPSSSA